MEAVGEREKFRKSTLGIFPAGPASVHRTDELWGTGTQFRSRTCFQMASFLVEVVLGLANQETKSHSGSWVSDPFPWDSYFYSVIVKARVLDSRC